MPGGATHSVHELDATSVSAPAYTLAIHKRAFEEHGLANVWPIVIALVVQPGVEFDHDAVVAYDRQKARAMVDWLREQPEEIVFEAHSTDYQLPHAYLELVEDGFAILKVGPALTFAMREGARSLGRYGLAVDSGGAMVSSFQRHRRDDVARAGKLYAILRGQSSRTKAAPAL